MAHAAAASQVLQVQLTVIGPSQPLAAFSCVQSPKVCAGIAERGCNRSYSVDSCPEVSKGIVFGGSTSDAASALPESKPLPTRLRSLPCLCDVGFVEFQQTLNISYCQSHNSYWQVGVCSWCGRQLSATATTSPRCQNASTENAGACAS